MTLKSYKQYDQESKLFNELAKKVVQSQNIAVKYEGEISIFQLDSVDIYFMCNNGFKIKVLDKNGCVVVAELDCAFVFGTSLEQQLQYKRYYMFHNLLWLVNSVYNQRQSQLPWQKRTESTQKQQENQVRLDKAVADKIAAEMTIKNSLQRLKYL